MMKTMMMKMRTVMKALLLALAVGVACADVDPAQISGPWRTFAIAADNLEEVQEEGPQRMLLRHIECQEGCNALNVFYYVRKNKVCTPHMVVAQKNADDVYTIEMENQNYLNLLGWASNNLVFINYYMKPNGTPTRFMFVALRAEYLNDERMKDFLRLTEQHGFPRENILRVDDTDTCPP